MNDLYEPNHPHHDEGATAWAHSVISIVSRREPRSSMDHNYPLGEWSSVSARARNLHEREESDMP